MKFADNASPKRKFADLFPQQSRSLGRKSVIGLRFSVTKLAGVLGCTRVCKAGVCRSYGDRLV